MTARSASALAEHPPGDKLPHLDTKLIKAFHKSLATDEQKRTFEEMMREAGVVKKKKKRQRAPTAAASQSPAPGSDAGPSARSLQPSASAPELDEFPKPYTVNFDGKRPDPKRDPLALTVGRLNVSLWGNINPSVYPQRFPLSESRASYIDRSCEHDDDGRNKEFNFVRNDMTVYTQNYHRTKDVLRLGKEFTRSPSYI
jgi:hypothetical protein